MGQSGTEESKQLRVVEVVPEMLVLVLLAVVLEELVLDVLVVVEVAVVGWRQRPNASLVFFDLPYFQWEAFIAL